MEDHQTAAYVKETHADLSRKYSIHGDRLHQIWPTLSQAQRTEAMKAGAADGAVLKHSLDASLGQVHKFLPEWNLHDITAPNSNSFLEIVKHRCTKSLEEQYISGPDDTPGDGELMTNMMERRNLRHVDSFKDCYTFFISDYYGHSIEIVKEKEETLAKFATVLQTRMMVPRSLGELVLQRQMYLLSALNIMIDDVLEIGSTTRAKPKTKPGHRSAVDKSTDKIGSLSIQEDKDPKMTVMDLVATAQDRKAAVEEYLTLLRTEPTVLSSATNIAFFTRPELLADDKGRSLPLHTGKYIGPAFLDAVCGAVQASATWDYISHLVTVFPTCKSKTSKATVLQELSNVCHLEYTRLQAAFKRQLAARTGPKWFKRVSSPASKIGARVVLKGNPETRLREDPLLTHLLQLCQDETNAEKAIDGLNKIGTLITSHPSERQKLAEHAVETLSDLAFIVLFVQNLRRTLSLPSFTRKRHQVFSARFLALEATLNEIKPRLDLSHSALPIDNLLEPGMAEKALKSLDDFLVKETGAQIGSLYLDAVEDGIEDLTERISDKPDEKTPLAGNQPAFIEDKETHDDAVMAKLPKKKTRPDTMSDSYNILPPSNQQATKTTQTTEASEPASYKLKVKPSSLQTFHGLFDRSIRRGSIPWSDFESAMADLRFSVTHKWGSVMTFYPDPAFACQKPITLHRPHEANIEGRAILFFGQRLWRKYGWTKDTFYA